MAFRMILLIAAALLAGAPASAGPQSFGFRGATLGMTLAEYRAQPFPDPVEAKPQLYCLPDPPTAAGIQANSVSCFWVLHLPAGNKPALLTVEGTAPALQVFHFARQERGAEPILFAIDMRIDTEALKPVRAALTALYGPSSEQPVLQMPEGIKPLSAETWRQGDERVWLFVWGEEFTLRYEIVSVAKANNPFVL